MSEKGKDKEKIQHAVRSVHLKHSSTGLGDAVGIFHAEQSSRCDSAAELGLASPQSNPVMLSPVAGRTAAIPSLLAQLLLKAGLKPPETRV